MTWYIKKTKEGPCDVPTEKYFPCWELLTKTSKLLGVTSTPLLDGLASEIHCQR